MKNTTNFLIKALKLILGVILGLLLSAAVIVGLDIILEDPNPYSSHTISLWRIGFIVAVCEFFSLCLMLRIRFSMKRIQTQDFDTLPESISTLIDSMIAAMGYRRSVQVEVRQELTDHFNDALADCENEQEKQTCIKELVEEFGDVKLIGTLLRRGKKRCRPLWRTMVARMCQLAGIGAILLTLYLGWFFAGTPNISTDYLEILNERRRPTANVSQNAWPYYEQAVQSYIQPKKIVPDTPDDLPDATMKMGSMIQEMDDLPKQFDTSPRSLKLLSDQERKVLNQWLLDNQPSLELILQGNQKRYCWKQFSDGDGNEESGSLVAILLPELAELRHLGMLMCWQGLLYAEKSDFDNAFESLLDSYRFGQNLRGQYTTIIEQLVAIAIESLSTRNLRMILSEEGPQLNADQLDSIRKRLTKIIDKKDFVIDYDSEKLALYDQAQRSFTQSRFGKSHLYVRHFDLGGALGPDNYEEVKILLHMLFRHPDKEQTLRQGESFYQTLDEMSILTPASQQALGMNMSQLVEETTKDNVFLKLMIPAFEEICAVSYISQIDTQATLTLMAILEYQKQNGKLPETLQVLVQDDLLQAVPIDPFSDKPLVYRKTNDGFTLYSFGRNLTDDDGVPGKNLNNKSHMRADNGDIVFWPLQQ